MATTWNPADNSDATLSGGNLVAAFATTNAFHSCRATTFKNAGKWYFEDTLQLSTAPDGAFWLAGVGNSSANLLSYVGDNDGNSAGFENNGQFTHEGTSTPLAWTPAALGDVIGFAIDISAGLFWVKDVTSGSVWNVTGAGANPATGVGGLDISFIPNRLTTGLCIMCSGYFSPSPPTAETHVLNAGATAFAGAVPAGFTAWDASGASDFPPPWSRQRSAAGVLIARPPVAWNMVLPTGLAPLTTPAPPPDEVRYNPLPLWGPLLAQ